MSQASPAVVSALLPRAAIAFVLLAGIFWFKTLNRPKNRRREAVRILAGAVLVLGLIVVIGDSLAFNPNQSEAVRGAAKLVATIAFYGAFLAIGLDLIAMYAYSVADLTARLRRTWRRLRGRPQQ